MEVFKVVCLKNIKTRCIIKEHTLQMMRTKDRQKCLSVLLKINAPVHDNKMRSLSFKL